MNEANFMLQRNDGKTPKDICNDDALIRLFTKYEEAMQRPNLSNDNIVIQEEDEDAGSDEEVKMKEKRSKGEEFSLKHAESKKDKKLKSSLVH